MVKQHAGLWKKGVSGNPSGRPSPITATIKQMILDKTNNGLDLVEKMIELSKSEDPYIAERGVKWLADYGLGRPKEHIEHSVDESLFSAILQSRTLESARN